MAQVRDRVSDRHCESILNLGERKFILHVKCFVQLPTGPNNTFRDELREGGQLVAITHYQCDPVNDAVMNDFRSQFERSIRDHWNDALVIAPVLPVPEGDELACEITLEWVTRRADAHMTMTMLRNPTPIQSNLGFRSYCWPQAPRHLEDMVIAFRSDGFDRYMYRRTSDRGEQAFHQNVAAHEFGHYLRLNHTCYSRATANAAADYCEMRTYDLQNTMMAVGNTIVLANAAPWISRLRRHNYRNDMTWLAVPAGRGGEIWDPALRNVLLGQA